MNFDEELKIPFWNNKYDYVDIVSKVIKEDWSSILSLIDYSRNHGYSYKSLKRNLFDEDFKYLIVEHDDVDKTKDHYKINPEVSKELEKYFKEYFEITEYMDINENSNYNFFFPYKKTNQIKSN